MRTHPRWLCFWFPLWACGVCADLLRGEWHAVCRTRASDVSFLHGIYTPVPAEQRYPFTYLSQEWNQVHGVADTRAFPVDKKKALLDTKITVNTFCNRSTQEDDADKNPAVQLYKLVMRAVRESNVFNVGEKTTLRKLLVGEGALISLLEAFAAGDSRTPVGPLPPAPPPAPSPDAFPSCLLKTVAAGSPANLR